MRLIVGCPVSSREWILPTWFDHCITALETANLDAEFCFVCSSNDVSTLKVINDRLDCDRHIVITDERKRLDKRNWNQDRYQEMVNIRNLLLSKIRELAPDYFLSLDSDILLHQDVIKNLLETKIINNCLAVGGKAYMSPRDRMYPSYGNLVNASLKRPDSEGVFSVDVIMAIKLMGPEAYNIDYVLHSHGEDIGWSKEAKKHGKLYWDGRITNKHVMSPKDLDRLDQRCGF